MDTPDTTFAANRRVGMPPPPVRCKPTPHQPRYTPLPCVFHPHSLIALTTDRNAIPSPWSVNLPASSSPLPGIVTNTVPELAEPSGISSSPDRDINGNLTASRSTNGQSSREEPKGKPVRPALR